MQWRPATLDEVKEILESDLAACDLEQLEAFKKYAVEPYLAPIVRWTENETVVVVARKENAVMYWEDIEEGFNISPLGPDGQILTHGFEQDELCWALNRWLGRR